jgi:chromosome segregation ATPase
MTPQTMPEALKRIDELQSQLAFARKTCDELVGLVDSLREAAAEARQDRDDAEAKLAHFQQVHAISTANLVRLQGEMAALEAKVEEVLR